MRNVLLRGLVITALGAVAAPAGASDTPASAAPAGNAAAAPTAAASTSKEDARRLFLAGKQAYQAGRVDVAAQSFEEAYRLEPAAALLFNLAQAYRKLYLINSDPATLKKAIADYRRYLAESPTGPNRALATEALSDLAPFLARAGGEGGRSSAASAPAAAPSRTEVMIVTETENATVKLDAQPPAPAPLLAAVSVGPHHATVAAEGYFPVEVRVTAVEGRLVTGEARLQPKPGRVSVVGDAGATVALDGREVGRLPLGAIEVPAGRHVVTAVERGRNAWIGEVQVDRDRTADVRPELVPTAQRRLSRWIFGAAVLSALASGAGGVVWGQADLAAGKLLGQYNSGTLSAQQLAEYQSDRDRRDTWRTATYAAIGVTGALALLAGAVYLFDRPSPPRVPPARTDVFGASTSAAATR